MTNPEISKLVRTVLRKRYGLDNVNVRIGKGTAHGWIYATVRVPQPSDCFCDQGMPHCSRCREALALTRREAEKIVYAAMEAAGARFGTYYSDDGYNTRRDEFILTPEFIRSRHV